MATHNKSQTLFKIGKFYSDSDKFSTVTHFCKTPFSNFDCVSADQKSIGSSFTKVENDFIVKWDCGKETRLKNVICSENNGVEIDCVWSNPNGGVYVLHNDGLFLHQHDLTAHCVIERKGWQTHGDYFYFEKTNVFIHAFLDGDVDSIWWWQLENNKSLRSFNDKPAYGNGSWNDELYVEKFNERFALVTHYYHEVDNCTCCNNSDNEEYVDCFTKEDLHFQTMIWDTKTFHTLFSR